ncbi:MAG: chemotaxis response regulator protein-glutamate methylesterase [Dictyoglomus sp.]|nr:chemotaxis response regulator protein-glutamate methylesterase [Dictyoglomus sp.]MDW8189202.1 chemotaxis response regulator protein-glutamate methylesterase [Dictyoglomus sp.]
MSKDNLNKIIKVLIVDDSAFVRKTLTHILSKSPFIEVVGTARDGEEALELAEKLNPDVITLDLIMPNMDGISFLREQMKRKPIPVVIVSIASESGELAIEALNLGAVDIVQKPTALATEKIYEISEDLIGKVKNASKISLTKVEKLIEKPPEKLEVKKELIKTKVDIIVIGVSTGGPQALRYLIPKFPKEFPVPIAVVIHMPVGYTELFAQKLNEIAELEVVEAKDGELLERGKVYIAPAGKHMLFVRKEKVYIKLDLKPFDTLHKPSIDITFRSAGEVFGERVLGVIMTGMGNDGTLGAEFIKSKGGKIFTEAEETCIIYGMPRSVEEKGLSDKVVPLYKMAEEIINFVTGGYDENSFN